MRIHKYHALLIILATGLCPLIMPSCSTCSRPTGAKVEVDESAPDSAFVKMAEQVFYSLPTPIEMSVMIKNLGVKYEASMLNSPKNADKYLTNSKMAANFGVYVTDLAYAGLFNQAQVMLHYKQAIQQMIDGLGMSAAVDNDLWKKLEENINNRHETMRLLSDTYASCTAYLNEADRSALTVTSLIGGWIEGMYIASSLTNENLVSTQQKVEQIVINQKLTFDMLWKALNDEKDKPEIAAIINELSGLAAAFDKIEIEQTPNKVETGKKDSSTVIHAETFSTANAEVFAEIKQQLQTIRYNLVK